MSKVFRGWQICVASAAADPPLFSYARTYVLNDNAYLASQNFRASQATFRETRAGYQQEVGSGSLEEGCAVNGVVVRPGTPLRDGTSVW